MTTLQIITLAIIQGVTEFLPISSTAHLILPSQVWGWPDQGLSFDIALHVGTLSAILVYFRHELVALTQGFFRSLQERTLNSDARLAWAILIGTIPIGLAGLAFKSLIEHQGRSILVIACSTLVFGIALGLADRLGKRRRQEDSISWKEGLLIGCAQAVAIIPGTSRSGITMTAGLWLGLTREAASRFSFLLAIPAMALSGGLDAVELLTNGHEVAWSEMGLGMLISAITGYICIDVLLKMLKKMSFMPFVIYRMALGVGLLWLYFGG